MNKIFYSLNYSNLGSTEGTKDCISANVRETSAHIYKKGERSFFQLCKEGKECSEGEKLFRFLLSIYTIKQKTENFLNFKSCSIISRLGGQWDPIFQLPQALGIFVSIEKEISITCLITLLHIDGKKSWFLFIKITVWNNHI